MRGPFFDKNVRKTDLIHMVGVSGFEPEASWTRTKRDTKLRHTPKRLFIISESKNNVK